MLSAALSAPFLRRTAGPAPSSAAAASQSHGHAHPKDVAWGVVATLGRRRALIIIGLGAGVGSEHI